MTVVVKYRGIAKKGLMVGHHVFRVGRQTIAVSGRPGNLGLRKVQDGSLVTCFVIGEVFRRILDKMTELSMPKPKTRAAEPRWKLKQIGQATASKPQIMWWQRD